MTDNVPDPRSPLSDREKESFPEVQSSYHELGMTRTGGSFLAKMGAMWKLVDERSGQLKGEGFHAIDEFKNIGGQQYYVGQTGAMVYIVGPDGKALSEGHHEVRHLGGNEFEGKTGASEEKFTLHI